MDIWKAIRPLGEHERNTTRFISHFEKIGRPAVPTANGKPVPVLMVARAWQDPEHRVAHIRTVAAIGRALGRVRVGKGLKETDFCKEFVSDRTWDDTSSPHRARITSLSR